MSAFRALVLSSAALFGAAAPAAAQESHLLVVTGTAGGEEHTTLFHDWASTLIEAAKTRDNVPEANITYLAERPDVDPALIRARASRENVEKALADIAAKAAPGEQVVIVLIGHGSFDGSEARFNLPGPDFTAAEWAGLLDRLSAQKVAFVNTSSSSGAFLPTVAAEGRTVVTATRTGAERYEPKFGGFFVEAFGEASADTDRNGHVSVLEAFNYADNLVAQAYKQEGLLRTENARLEDGGGGKLAGTQFLTARPSDGGLKVDLSSPEMRGLVAEREALQKEIDALRLQKDALDQAKYDAELERLLTALALKTREIRDLEAKGSGGTNPGAKP